jgi:hypothetical protein
MCLPGWVDEYQPMVCQVSEVNLFAILGQVQQSLQRRHGSAVEQLLRSLHNRQTYFVLLSHRLSLVCTQNLSHLGQSYLFLTRQQSTLCSRQSVNKYFKRFHGLTIPRASLTA